uniref:Uncharacterized protein n=1 Tax=Cacopsylla melanoneura TaxID=428564 RepID=A0A8D8SLF1_9HEMI
MAVPGNTCLNLLHLFALTVFVSVNGQYPGYGGFQPPLPALPKPPSYAPLPHYPPPLPIKSLSPTPPKYPSLPLKPPPFPGLPGKIPKLPGKSPKLPSPSTYGPGYPPKFPSFPALPTPHTPPLPPPPKVEMKDYAMYGSSYQQPLDYVP